MRLFGTIILGLALGVPAQAKPGTIDSAAVFEAAGFRLEDGTWKKCDDPGTMSYTPGAIDEIGDLDGDGLPEAVVTEGSSYCYGFTGTAFSLVSRHKDGWKLILESVGVPVLLETGGVGGWPDLEIGGPGFCFPKLRWDGTQYRETGYSYEGKACTP